MATVLISSDGILAAVDIPGWYFMDIFQHA